jgi:hypothetical protein
MEQVDIRNSRISKTSSFLVGVVTLVGFKTAHPDAATLAAAAVATV